MDASEWVSWAYCPDCGGLVAVGWLDGEPVAVDCVGGCPLRIDQVLSPADRRDGAVMLGEVEQMADHLEEAVLDTMAAHGLGDPRVAATLVADTWADILRGEGRPLQLVALATQAVREIGERLHRQLNGVETWDLRDASDDLRVLVVAEQPMLRMELIETLASEADVSVVGECENGSAVVEAAARLRPHVVCVDRSIPIEDRRAATQALRAADPEVRIVLLIGGSGARRDSTLADADAVVPKEAGSDALLRCVRTVGRRGTGCPYCL
jgi:CheY-like chemotaxis protein